METNKIFKFEEELREGLVLSRPNRFIMMVKIGNEIVKAHCPSTGRIGNIVFKNIPCLFSTSDDKKRKTNYTVEAISLDPESKKNKKWIGINQVRANRVVEYFIKTGQLNEILNISDKNPLVRREVKLGNSKIDFLINQIYLEVKTPLNIMSLSPAPSSGKQAKFNSFERIIKHFGDLSKYITKSGRAVVAMCYFYDAPPFIPPVTDKYNLKIKKAATKAHHSGLETWQINFKIDKQGVNLVKFFKLNLF